MPIVFALGVAGVAGLLDRRLRPAGPVVQHGVGFRKAGCCSPFPAFVFAGGLMEKCGMSHALVDFARALVGWSRGLGMS